MRDAHMITPDNALVYLRTYLSCWPLDQAVVEGYGAWQDLNSFWHSNLLALHGHLDMQTACLHMQPPL